MNHPTSTIDARRLPVNPFVTRRIRPGAIPYIFPADDSLDALLERLRERHGWGQIVGPHGSGKSTMLESLLPKLSRRAARLEFFTLHQSERRLPVTAARTRDWDEMTQVVVDGYEQLSWWNRTRLKRLCRRCRAGLLVTTHRDMGLPMLLATDVSQETAQAVVDRLLGGSSAWITTDDVARTFDSQQGNLREILFALYDLYQQRRR